MRNNPNSRAPGTGTQIPIEREDGSPVSRYKCSRCTIFYDTVEPTPKCPLCRAEQQTEQMRLALQNATTKLEMLERQNMTLNADASIVHAMKEATELLNTADRMFLKSVLYQWRQDKSVSLKIHSHEGKVAGFIAVWRNADPEGYTCSSIGGKALAGYYQEALQGSGSAKAIEALMRACQHLLSGDS